MASTAHSVARALEKRVKKRRGAADPAAAHQLDLYIENTSELYPQKKLILRALGHKLAKGTYDAGKAARLWLYWVDAGVKQYHRENPEEAPRGRFTPATRDLVARDLERHYRGEIELGNYG